MVGVSYHDADTGHGVVGLDYALVHVCRLGLDDFAGSNARGADSGATGVGAVFYPDPLNVGQPTTIVAFVGETDGFAVTRLFSADLASIRHDKFSWGGQ